MSELASIEEISGGLASHGCVGQSEAIIVPRLVMGASLNGLG